MTGKKCILPIESYRADQIFNPVGVDLDTAVGQEGLQPVPVIVDIGELLTQPRLCRYLATLRLKPFPEGRDQRCGARLTCGQALSR